MCVVYMASGAYRAQALDYLGSNGHHPSHHDPEAENRHKAPRIKKPLNAFMLFMKEMRPKVIEECSLKESAAINQILGRKVSGGGTTRVVDMSSQLFWVARDTPIGIVYGQWMLKCTARFSLKFGIHIWILNL